MQQNIKHPDFKELDIGAMLESARTKYKGMMYYLNRMVKQNDDAKDDEHTLIEPQFVFKPNLEP